MVQDLKFGNCTLNSYNGDGSEAATTKTPTVANGYVGHCRSLTLSTAGYHYTWAGTMNNTKAYSGAPTSSISCVGTDPDPDMCRGVCPYGWHVPTRQELIHAEEAFKLSGCSGINCWNENSAFEGVRSCYTRDNDVTEPRDCIYYWSSTWYVSGQSYCIAWPGRGSGASDYCAQWGLPVRCIRNN
ncbi:MAG: hypothetical protein LBD52_01140 [Prevotellaceae bacterium]|jgi:uncharacterized protein (TIGR02145 family)|nr:hypothetical protein [Prevotellaceae bacterium]